MRTLQTSGHPPVAMPPHLVADLFSVIDHSRLHAPRSTYRTSRKSTHKCCPFWTAQDLSWDSRKKLLEHRLAEFQYTPTEGLEVLYDFPGNAESWNWLLMGVSGCFVQTVHCGQKCTKPPLASSIRANSRFVNFPDLRWCLRSDEIIDISSAIFITIHYLATCVRTIRTPRPCINLHGWMHRPWIIPSTMLSRTTISHYWF